MEEEIKINDKVSIQKSNINCLSELEGRIYKVIDIKTQDEIKKYKIDMIFMWLNENQIKKIL